MNIKNNIIIKKIPYSTPKLAQVISLAIGNPTNDKIQKIIGSYQEDNQYLIGVFYNMNLVALLGFEKTESQGKIRHISVLPKFTKQGIGKALINFIYHEFNLSKIIAETDEDTVGFYQKLGFICKQFKSKYNIRYHCIYT